MIFLAFKPKRALPPPDNKKRVSSHEPLVLRKKSPKAFLFYIQMLPKINLNFYL